MFVFNYADCRDCHDSYYHNNPHTNKQQRQQLQHMNINDDDKGKVYDSNCNHNIDKKTTQLYDNCINIFKHICIQLPCKIKMM